MKEITCTPGVQGGEPCIAGTRTPVRTIVALYYHVYPFNAARVLAALPHLTAEQFSAALCYYCDHQAEIDEIIRLNDEAGAALLAATRTPARES